MDAEFWHERWRANRIAFHQNRVNALLERHHHRLLRVSAGGPDRPVVLVPLCGRSLDMWWLREQGWQVLGVELSEIAVRDFFAERGFAAVPETDGPFTRYAADDIELLVGDVFDLTPERLAGVDAVYDRAALVALPPDLRRRYVVHMQAALPERSATLLITFEYPQHEFDGPPFSVSPGAVDALYSATRTIELVESVDALRDESGLAARGATALAEHAFLLTETRG